MTLRLTDDDRASLELAAEQAGMSLHSFAVEAIRNEVQRRAQREEVEKIAESISVHHRELLDRLTQWRGS